MSYKQNISALEFNIANTDEYWRLCRNYARRPNSSDDILKAEILSLSAFSSMFISPKQLLLPLKNNQSNTG